MNMIKKKISTFLKQSTTIETDLGGFSIGKVLGEGGTSIVKSATLLLDDNSELKQEFAIKFLAENICKKESTVYKRFKQAHINLLLIQNSGCVLPQIHFGSIEIQKDITIPYIILKKAKLTLKEYKLKNEITTKIFETLFDSLIEIIEKIHSFGIIHWDLKPENIFILDGKIVLGDFDIASFNDKEGVKLVETKKSDRLANYFFSAPEQSEKQFDEITKAADWYAFGQILFWLIHNRTYRGTDHVVLREHDELLTKYESIVTDLLKHNPSDRLSSKEEILEHIKKNEASHQNFVFRKEKETSLHQFDEIIYKYMSSLGMSGSGFKKFSNPNDIEEIISDLQQKQNLLDLWFSQGYSDSAIKKITKLDSTLCYLFDYYEFKLKSVWIYKHISSFGGSFIVLEMDDLEPSGLYDYAGKVEEVGMFSKKHFITREEYDTGWAVIDGKRTNTLGNTELRVRTLQPDIHFLAPHWGPIVENIEIFDQVYKNYCKHYILDEHVLQALKKVRRKPDVYMHD